jgi:NAD+ kinase
MADKIRRVGLLANSDKAACRNLVRQTAALIQASHRLVASDAATAKLAGLRLPCSRDAAHLVQEVDLLMVFGGDGTMLRVAREVAGAPTPILGINVGGLGFLTDVPSHQLPLALEQIWAGDIILESRPLLEASGQTGGRPISELALNDFVITRGAEPRLIELEVCVNSEPLTRYRCDGLIVASPTGSTAYSLSAGGAVVSPDAEVFTLTPICPHTLSNRSVIVSLNSIITVKVLSRRVATILNADGREPTLLQPDDVMTIQRSQRAIRLLHLSGSSFFETLRRKLNWRGSNV